MSNIIEKARRYVDNVRELLRDKAHKEDGYYQDTKYVKIAGHTAYAGILVALDEFLEKKARAEKTRSAGRSTGIRSIWQSLIKSCLLPSLPPMIFCTYQ